MPLFQQFPWPTCSSTCGALVGRVGAALLLHATLVGGVRAILPRARQGIDPQPSSSRAPAPEQVAWPKYVEVERPITLPELPRPEPVHADTPAATELAPLDDGARRLSAALAQPWTHVPVVPSIAAASPAPTPSAGAPSRPAATIDETTHAPIYVPASLVIGAPPVYPSRSRRAGEAGSVKLRIRVEADGSVGDVWIVEGSGFERLDQAASQAVRGWTFKAATTDGVATPSLVIHTVTFKLDRPRQ